MKRTLIFFEILCMIFFLLFSSADKRTQFLTSLAGPGMLSLVKQASAKATASENFSTDMRSCHDTLLVSLEADDWHW